MPKYLIGIDIGTQGTKTAVYDENTVQIASSFEPSRLIYGKGSVIQDPDDIYGSVIRTIKDALLKAEIPPSDICGIAADGQMAGIMGIGDDFSAVTPYDSWLDTRCLKYADVLKATAQDEIESLTGCPITVSHGPKILWWKNEFHDIYKRIVSFVEPVTYVCGRLCGLKASDAYIDTTNIHFSGFADNKKLEWSSVLCSEFGVDIAKMPRIIESTEIVGHLTKAAADLIGLIPGIPVAAGCGDQAATSIGAGVTKPGECFDGAGTASVFSVCSDEYKPDLKYRTLLYPHHVINGLWQPMAYISGGGMCLKWFKEQLLGDKYTYRELEDKAELLSPGSGNVYFIPHFSGRTCPSDPNVRGMFWGMNYDTPNYAMFRAVMESIAYEYKHYLSIIRESCALPDNLNVHAVGGGAKSPCFNKIKADILGAEYSALKLADCATRGSALVAGCSVGIFTDIAKAAVKGLNTAHCVSPDAEAYKEYAVHAQKYTDLLNKCGMLNLM